MYDDKLTINLASTVSPNLLQHNSYLNRDKKALLKLRYRNHRGLFGASLVRPSVIRAQRLHAHLLSALRSGSLSDFLKELLLFKGSLKDTHVQKLLPCLVRQFECDRV